MVMDFRVRVDYNCFDLDDSTVIHGGCFWEPVGFLFVVHSALHIRGSTSADSASLQNSICIWLNLRKQNLWIWGADSNSQVWASGKKMTLSDKVVLPRWSPIIKDSKKTVDPCDCEAQCQGDGVWQIIGGVRLSSQGYKITSLNSIIIPTRGT